MYWTVTREGGSGWDRTRSLREQDQWDEHAAYMDGLEDAGFVRIAGPVGDGGDRHRVSIIVEAGDEATVHARLAEDPWTASEVLRTVTVEPWNVLIGAHRLA